MNPKTPLLPAAHAGGLIVYPYTDESHILGELSAFAGAGHGNNEAVTRVTTGEHRADIERRLSADSFDVEFLDEGRLTFFSTSGLLCQVFDVEMPDRNLFAAATGQTIEMVRGNSTVLLPNGGKMSPEILDAHSHVLQV